ncbi:SagB/ThcOx family dehydrogenase [Pseudomonas fluorescens]|uniref:SagB/ThcOx family dehydrogenase n=1 Tax=Pseudomonas fluorescens TaxID=294 RepID=UPI001782511C|nr:SagB/ThcOx family dehydrogenase [Pseudomonas fluorescens]
MTWIDLGSPLPRDIIEPYELVRWPTGEIRRLPIGLAPQIGSFEQVLASRQTRREFREINDDQLSRLLRQACSSREAWPSAYGFDLEHRATPSAGAVHPIHLVLHLPGDPRWWLYQPQGHYLVEICGAAARLDGLLLQCADVLEGDRAVHILFVAEPGKTLTKYHDGCSLIWRDAGALLAIIALTAHAHGLNFCPLGITGEPWASALADQGKLVGVGLGLLGAPR